MVSVEVKCIAVEGEHKFWITISLKHDKSTILYERDIIMYEHNNFIQMPW